MPAGKLASQCGHAFEHAMLSASPDRIAAYRSDGIGTKICLSAQDLDELTRLQAEAESLGLPHFMVEDTGRNTTFGGVPTISALGIGPLWPHETAFLKKLKLFR